MVETINAELSLDDSDSIDLYARAWNWLHESAVYGHSARRLITRARPNWASPAPSPATLGVSTGSPHLCAVGLSPW